MDKSEFDNLNYKKEYESLVTNKNGHKVKRKLVTKSKYVKELEKDIEFKYKEKILFQKLNNKGKTAICIGYNPAKSCEDIDITNKRLIECLWEDYDGYELVNLYPQVSSDKTTCINDLDENYNFINVIVDIIENDEKDIILFWGRTLSLSDELYNAICNRLDKHLTLKMTTHNNKFTHPGANSAIEIKKCSKENLKTSHNIE